VIEEQAVTGEKITLQLATVKIIFFNLIILKVEKKISKSWEKA
jgi:hypothetical protein